MSKGKSLKETIEGLIEELELLRGAITRLADTEQRLIELLECS